jgi:hypothetical protein
MPVIDVYDLEKAIEIQFGEEVLAHYEMRQLLFGDQYINDCYMRYYFGDVFEADEFDDENQASVLNLINQFLRDEFPGLDAVLVDVSW